MDSPRMVKEKHEQFLHGALQPGELFRRDCVLIRVLTIHLFMLIFFPTLSISQTRGMLSIIRVYGPTRCMPIGGWDTIWIRLQNLTVL